MYRQPVKSSNLRSVGYDVQHGILEVEFHNGSIYQYFGVQANKHKELMLAESHGKYLHEHIKDKYKYQRL